MTAFVHTLPAFTVAAFLPLNPFLDVHLLPILFKHAIFLLLTMFSFPVINVGDSARAKLVIELGVPNT